MRMVRATGTRRRACPTRTSKRSGSCARGVPRGARCSPNAPSASALALVHFLHPWHTASLWLCPHSRGWPAAPAWPGCMRSARAEQHTQPEDNQSSPSVRQVGLPLTSTRRSGGLPDRWIRSSFGACTARCMPLLLGSHSLSIDAGPGWPSLGQDAPPAVMTCAAAPPAQALGRMRRPRCAMAAQRTKGSLMRQPLPTPCPAAPRELPHRRRRLAFHCLALQVLLHSRRLQQQRLAHWQHSNRRSECQCLSRPQCLGSRSSELSFSRCQHLRAASRLCPWASQRLLRRQLQHRLRSQF